jgi:hypothetical protein
MAQRLGVAVFPASPDREVRIAWAAARTDESVEEIALPTVGLVMGVQYG